MTIQEIRNMVLPAVLIVLVGCGSMVATPQQTILIQGLPAYNTDNTSTKYYYPSATYSYPYSSTSTSPSSPNNTNYYNYYYNANNYTTPVPSPTNALPNQQLNGTENHLYGNSTQSTSDENQPWSTNATEDFPYEYYWSSTAAPAPTSERLSWRDSNPYFGLHEQQTETPNNDSTTHPFQHEIPISACDIQPPADTTEPNCNQTVKKYFFNRSTKECEFFVHSSCDDGVNVFFTSYEHCASLCEVYYKENFITSLRVEPKSDEQDKNALNRADQLSTTTISPVLSTPTTPTPDDKQVSSLITFTIVQIWDAQFDSEQQFKLIKNIKTKLNQIYGEHDKYNATFFDISPKPDEIIPVNLTSARIIVEHGEDVNPLEPLIKETRNHRMAPVVVLSNSWKSENFESGDQDKLINSCSRMDIPMSNNCKDSKFGCCYDEIMEAVGPEKQGCPEKNCPCKLFMVSFGVSSNSNATKTNLEDTFSLENDINNLVEMLNKTYEGQIMDLFVDWRECYARKKPKNQTITGIRLLDIAILLTKQLDDPFKPLFDFFKNTPGFGNLNIVPNSLIISHAYGVSVPEKDFSLHEPLLHLNFNKFPTEPNVTKREQIRGPYSYCGEAHDLSNPLHNPLPSVSRVITGKHQKQLTLAFWLYNNRTSGGDRSLPDSATNDHVNVIWARNHHSHPSPLLYLKNNKMFANFFTLNQTVTCSNQIADQSTRNYWTHFVVTFDSIEGKIKLYQDGDVIKSCSTNTSYNQPLIPLKEITVGESLNKSLIRNKSQYFVDELFIYSEILTHTSINELYQKCSETVNPSSNTTENSCNEQCPPPFSTNVTEPKSDGNQTETSKKTPLYPIRSCFEYKMRCSRHRTGVYEAITAVNIDGSTYITDSSNLSKTNVYCDMSTNGGGWELVFNSINGDGWSAAQILERNVDVPSLNSSYSTISKFVQFVSDKTLSEKQYMIIINKGDYVEGGIWNVTDNGANNFSSISLQEKFGDWSNESNINQRIPYIHNDGFDLFVTTSLDPKSEPYGTLASTSGLLEPYQTKNFDLIFGVSLWIRYQFKNYTRNVDVFDEMSQTEIEQYYLNAEIINPLHEDILIYYDMGEEKKAFEVKAHNRSTLFNVIHSISMPLSVGFQAFEKYSLKQLRINGRLTFESPISYIPNDFVIMIVSEPDSNDDIEKPLVSSFDYDYILYNTLDYAVNVTVNFLGTTPVQYLIAPHSYENWKTKFYATEKIDFVASANSSAHPYPLYVEDSLAYIIEPMIASLNATNVLSITETPLHTGNQSTYRSCHAILNLQNTLPYSVDVFWRDDSLMATVKSNQSQPVAITFNYGSNITAILQNISIYSCVHGRFYDSMCDIEVNGEKNASFVCVESQTPLQPVTDLVLSSKKSFQDYENELKNIKYNIYSIGGESVCPPEIHGGYSDWKEWSECFVDRSSSDGVVGQSGSPPKIKSRTRSCNDPQPKNGGMGCEEIFNAANYETKVCSQDDYRPLKNSSEPPVVSDVPLQQFTPINITLVNDVDSVVLVNWEILLNTNQTWQRGNIVINQNSSRVISISNSEIVNSGAILLSAKNLNTGKLMVLRDSKHLTLQLDLIQNNLVINIGHEKVYPMKRFYSQITVINLETETALISFTKDGTLLSSLEEIPGNNTKKTFKYSFVSLNNRPSPIIVRAYSSNRSLLYVNGLKEHVVKLGTSQFEYVILLISKNMSRYQIEHKLYSNFILANMNPTASVQLKIDHPLLAQKTLILQPTNLVSFYRKIILPNDYVCVPVKLWARNLTSGDSDWVKVLELPFLNNNSFIEYVPVWNDLRYHHRSGNDSTNTYNLNLKVTNVGESAARVEWRVGLAESLVNPGNEVKIQYHIRSPVTLPVFVVRAYEAYYENELFINGQNSSYAVASPKHTSNFTNTLLVSSSDLKPQNYEEYVEPINTQMKIYNYLPSEKVILFVHWNNSYFDAVNVEPYSSLTYNFTKSYSNEIVLVKAITADKKPVTVNGTYRLGIRPFENNTQVLLYVGDKPKTHYFGIRLANTYNRHNINFHWAYKNENKNASFINENQIDLVMRLSRVDTKPITIWATNANTNDDSSAGGGSYEFWSINNKVERIVIPPQTIQNSMTESLDQLKWVILSVGSVIGKVEREQFDQLPTSYINHTLPLSFNNIADNSTISLFVKDPTDQFYEHFSFVHPTPNSESILLACCSKCSNQKTLTILDNMGNVYSVNNQSNVKFSFTENKTISVGQITKPKHKFDQVTVGNRLQEAVLLEWFAALGENTTRGQVYVEPDSWVDVTQDINYVASQLNDGDSIHLKAVTYDAQQRHLFVNGTGVYSVNLSDSSSSSSGYSKHIRLSVDSANLYFPDYLRNESSPLRLYRLLLDNTLDLTVKTTVNDKTYHIEPKGILEINQESSVKNQLLPIVMSAHENSTQYPLLLNGTTGQVEFTLSPERPATHIRITPPHLPSLPKSSYVFLELTGEGKVKDEPTIVVHGSLLEYREKNKTIGILFTGNDSWAGIHLTGSNCVIEPTYCSKGFTIALKLAIASPSSLDTSERKYILDSGGHGGSSTGITLTAEGGKIYFQVTTTSKTWLVDAQHPYDKFFTVIASWQPESGLYLHVDGVLVSSEHNGEMLFSTQDLDINPNLLIGRNINGNTVTHSKFVMVYLAIFDKYFNQQEATSTYLQLSDPKHAKAQFNLLRLFNQLERAIKLEVSTNGNYANKVLVPQNTKGDILTLVDMNRTNDKLYKEKHVQIPKTTYVAISATDSELGTPLYINNQPSPIKLSLDNNEYKEYVNVILSAPSKIMEMEYLMAFSPLSADRKTIANSSPTIFTFGNVIESQAATVNQSISLDGVTAYMQIEKFRELECLTQPLFCDKGFTLVTTLRLNEVVNDDNNPHFIIDTGGHNGKGFSLFYLGGRLVAEVSQNRKVWKIETRLIIGEWMMVAVTWKPHSGGKLGMMINGNDYKHVEKSSDLQGTSTYSNTTFIIGKPVVESSGSYGKFFIKHLALSEVVYDENDLTNYFLFYNNHNKPPSSTRYISVNFQNRAGQDILIKPDRGEHHSEGYLINAGLMLELRLEEKGVVTTYPIVFKAFGLTSDKEYLLNNDWSVVVDAEEDRSLVTNVIITMPLFCPKKEGLFPDPNDKTIFISCQEGIARRENCPTNSVWNDDLKSCSVVVESKQEQPPADLTLKNKTTSPPPVYFILKNTTPKNVTIIKVYDKANTFKIGPHSTVIWKPKSNFKYPTALVALEGDYKEKTLGDRLLVNGQSVFMVNLTPKANQTILIVHRNETDWKEPKFTLMRKLYGMQPYFEVNSKKKAEVIMANLIDEKVQIVDENDLMIDFIMNPNEIVKIKIENTQPLKSIVFTAASSAPGTNQTYMINNMTSIDVNKSNLTDSLTNITFPVAQVAVVHKKDDPSWQQVYNSLIEIQNQFKLANASIAPVVDSSKKTFYELTLRIKLITPLDVVLRETTGTNFKVGLKSELNQHSVATDLQLGLNVSTGHRLIFTAAVKEGETEKTILINGLTEWKLGDIDNITGTTLAVVIHELGQDWINHFNSLMENVHSNGSSSKSQIVPDILLWNYPQLYYLTVKFYNDIDGDIIIKSVDGILNITTVFPSKSIGTIDLYIPLSAVITFVAQDINHNSLYLNNQPNISVSVSSPVYSVVAVTRTNHTANKDPNVLTTTPSTLNETINKSVIHIDGSGTGEPTSNLESIPIYGKDDNKPMVNPNKDMGSIGKLFS